MSEPARTIGQLIDETAQRDAIHIAIAPVIAACLLQPGQRVGFVEKGNCELVGVGGASVGIIDPFLTKYVETGERCWLFLFPNTVTSLRHEWTHPLFPPAAPVTQSKHEIYLRLYAERMNDYEEPDKAFAMLIDGLRSGEMFFHGGSSVYGFHDLPDPDELRRHAESYLGITIDWNRFTFSCAC